MNIEWDRYSRLKYNRCTQNTWDRYSKLKYNRCTQNNPTMASAALPSAADPKMADLCNHTAHASSSDGFAEDGYFKCHIQPNFYGDIWSVSGFFFFFGVGRPLTRN